MPIDVQRARTQTPGVAHRIHLNNCGASPMPAPVIEAVSAHLKLEAEIGGYEAAEVAVEQVEHTYDAVARLLNCSREEIALVENATNGWCMAFYAFDFQPGDRILTAVSEYATNYRLPATGTKNGRGGRSGAQRRARPARRERAGSDAGRAGEVDFAGTHSH